jgi:hypothetical protein
MFEKATFYVFLITRKSYIVKELDKIIIKIFRF